MLAYILLLWYIAFHSVGRWNKNSQDIKASVQDYEHLSTLLKCTEQRQPLKGIIWVKHYILPANLVPSHRKKCQHATLHQKWQKLQSAGITQAVIYILPLHRLSLFNRLAFGLNLRIRWRRLICLKFQSAVYQRRHGKPFENSHFRQWIHAAPEKNEMSKRKNTKAQIAAGQKERKKSLSI